LYISTLINFFFKFSPLSSFNDMNGLD
jgi:hypothetical protein